MLDFSGQNLRGRSFQKQDLQGANFSYADLSSADFREANLEGANFSHAKTGLQGRWTLITVLVAIVLAAAAGLVTAFMSSIFINTFQLLNPGDVLIGLTYILVLATFYWTTLGQGLSVGAGTLVGLGSWVTLLAWATTYAGAGAGADPIMVAMIVALTLAVNLAVTLGGAIAAAAAMAVGGLGALLLVEVMAMLGAVPGALVGASIQIGFAPLPGHPIKMLAILLAGVDAMIAAYLGWLALGGDRHQTLIYHLAVILTTSRGTNFKGANLTKANFYQASLQNVDLRQANLEGTNWYQPKMLTLLRSGETYLQDPVVLHLVTTHNGQGYNFHRKNLQGVNLEGAKLADADLSGAYLNYANLKNADLSRANLKQAQLDGADLTGARLTGAYIEDWGITAKTHLDLVDCEYVYMHVPTVLQPNPRRKPDNYRENFAPGDFTDFIKPIKDTLDLYHNQSVDPRAIAIAYKKLEENHPVAALEIVAMEKRGNNFLLRAKTDPVVDRSQLSNEYFQTYNQFKFMPDSNISLVMALQNDRIRSLESMITTALQRPSIYAQHYRVEGDTMSESQSSNISIGNVGGDIAGFAGGDVTGVAGKISGSVSSAIGQLQGSPLPEISRLATLLEQLQGLIEQDPHLTPEDKAEALQQVKVLAEAGQKNTDSGAQKAAKTALKILKGTIAGVSQTTKLVEEGAKLLVAIASLLTLL